MSKSTFWEKIRKNIVNLLFADFAQGMVKFISLPFVL